MKQLPLRTWFLRLSIASVFLYAAIDATLQPSNWIGFIPTIFYSVAPAQALLVGFSFYQLLLALLLLFGYKPFITGLIAAATLLAIIAANFTDIDILFRDFAIFFASLALAVDNYQQRKRKQKE